MGLYMRLQDNYFMMAHPFWNRIIAPEVNTPKLYNYLM